ncbi:MAG: transketolase family protein [Candidatus Omnitrophica bacterium]|nr:transketolase family protein [Candidatus Omnitrophota bacterium]
MADKIPTRDGFGKRIVELGKDNEKIFVMSADLEDATRAEYFRDAYPKRFMTVGIAEQDLVGTAVGLSMQGYIPVICSFAVFLTNRAYDMIRLDICYNDANVKIVCSHAGVTVGQDGASAQCLEDFALMRVLPRMRVVCPVDAIEAKKATDAIISADGPMYMRTSRGAFPVITKESDPFEIGKGVVLREGTDATVIACGIMVSSALEAAESLAKENISVNVINMHTIKPIDTDLIVAAAQQTGAIVTAEEHQVYGGLGGAVVEVLAQHYPVPVEMVAVQDTFGQTGAPQELLDEYHLSPRDIVAAVRKAVKRK